jgi:hypothetical protein
MKTAAHLLLALAGLAGSTTALAARNDDALAACMVQSASAQERTLLVRWMFAGMAAHPAVEDLAQVSKEQASELNREVAALFMALLSDRCRAQTREAVDHGGVDPVAAAFGALGRAAMRDLREDGAVDTYMGQFSDHLDKVRLGELLTPTPEKKPAVPAQLPAPVPADAPPAPVEPGKN